MPCLRCPVATLIVCEKPSVAAKTAAAVARELGVPSKASGRGVKHFTVGEYFVAPAVGHLYGLKQKGTGSGYPIYEIEWVPSCEVSDGSAFTKKYLTALAELAKKSDSVIVACDYDIEGSLIGWNVARFLAPGKPLKRMKFSLLTPAELGRAFKQLREMDLNNALAGEARHKLDWLYGINLSRALMQAVRSAGAFKVLSVGRVQGPALSILAKRELEIASFKPEPFWQLFAWDGDAEFVHEKERFFDKAEADEALEKSAGEGRITGVTRKKVRQAPPHPYDLTTLQTDAYRCFGFSPARTLKIAQSLYEAALISYPRTSSQKLSVELGLDEVIRKLAENPSYSVLARKLIESKKFAPSQGKKDDPAHPAIFPTGEKPGALRTVESKLYDLVVKRFLACFADSLVKESLSVILRLGKENYLANGSTVLKKGWLEFFGGYASIKETLLPDYKDGQVLRVKGPELIEKETQPPKRFTAASTVRELEKKGLGTKATRSQILETLFNRGYLTGSKSIQVTELGLSVYRTLHSYCDEIASVKLTREIEAEVEQISEGKADPDKVVEHGRKDLDKILRKFKESEEKIGKNLLSALKETRREQNKLGECKCGGDLILRKSRFGLFVGCNNYPDCKQTYPLPKNALIQSLDQVCEKCGTPIVKVIRKGRRPFVMCLDPQCLTKANWGNKKEARPPKE